MIESIFYMWVAILSLAELNMLSIDTINLPMQTFNKERKWCIYLLKEWPLWQRKSPKFQLTKSLSLFTVSSIWHVTGVPSLLIKALIKLLSKPGNNTYYSKNPNLPYVLNLRVTSSVILRGVYFCEITRFRSHNDMPSLWHKVSWRTLVVPSLFQLKIYYASLSSLSFLWNDHGTIIIPHS